MLHRPLIYLAAGTVLAALAAWFTLDGTATATRHAVSVGGETITLTLPQEPTAAGQPAVADTSLEIPQAQPAADAIDEGPATVWQEITVKRGDTLAGIFSRLGLTAQQLHALMEQGGAIDNLKKIYPGQVLRILTSAENGLETLLYPIDKLSTLEISRNGDEFDVSTTHQTPERRVKNASGVIDSSLFLAAGKAGMSDSMTMELAGIFGWDIDFALDIRKGDEFAVMYEDLYLEGEFIGHGNILAAEFVNNGKRFQAVRYTDAGGKTDYYSLDGKSMRKAFLRTPVEFSRISSRFSTGRKHPILNKIRAHKGVDYAAAHGTPIRATGNGKIVHRGRKGGYGNTIVIKHGTQYSTLYAHMSKYRKGLKVGSRVEQGQIIGYIGSSGLATGPHLHYEFRVNDVHRDPLRVKLPGAEPLQKKYLDDFREKADSLLAQLELIRDVQVASNQQ
ncbi:MAG: peptidoglycan DD-metalloendopeptidase family protein [Thiohalobacterales bacterium]|nr:peptidoglycan DD-metalloendopeptidase family protein [Thiohalobacterales bacterium]